LIEGDYKARVLKVNIPRSDLKITVQGFFHADAVWFRRVGCVDQSGGCSDVLMGDLVLLQEEVNPVLSALLDNGIDVTALHNHFLWTIRTSFSCTFMGWEKRPISRAE